MSSHELNERVSQTCLGCKHQRGFCRPSRYFMKFLDAADAGGCIPRRELYLKVWPEMVSRCKKYEAN